MVKEKLIFSHDFPHPTSIEKNQPYNAINILRTHRKTHN